MIVHNITNKYEIKRNQVMMSEKGDKVSIRIALSLSKGYRAHQSNQNKFIEKFRIYS